MYGRKKRNIPQYTTGTNLLLLNLNYSTSNVLKAKSEDSIVVYREAVDSKTKHTPTYSSILVVLIAVIVLVLVATVLVIFYVRKRTSQRDNITNNAVLQHNVISLPPATPDNGTNSNSVVSISNHDDKPGTAV